MTRRDKSVALLLTAVLLMAAAVSVALASYSAHGDDKDIANFKAVFPGSEGTRLDDCYLCHSGGALGKKVLNSCDYCHETYKYEPPHGEIPLNAFGRAYMDAGRNKASLEAIADADNDGDGYSNRDEIAQNTFPGDPIDRPGLARPRQVTLRLDDLVAMPKTKQFMLMNTTKSGDFYATYTGVSLKDLLMLVKASPEAESITVFAPDGFSKDISMKAINTVYPPSIYYAGLPWVEYPETPVFPDKSECPDQQVVLVAYERDGKPLGPGRLEYAGNRWVLEGEGPYRLIVPQERPLPPDRPSTAPDKDSEPYPFNPEGDHNAGAAVRSIVAIRVNPLPEGVGDLNWQEGGWNLVDKGELVIYGAIER